jgi:exonuclease VII large subunit
MVEDQIRIAFPRRMWVTGRVAASRTAGGGGGGGVDYVFQLIEQREAHEELTLPCLLPESAVDDVTGSLSRLHDAAIDDLLVDGHLLRAGGLLAYDFSSHRLTFSVTALDPEATAGGLADERAKTAEVIRQDSLTGRQRTLSMAAAPLRVAVVGPRGDEAVEAGCQALETSEFDIDLTLYEPAVRGNEAIEQLTLAVRRATTSRHDIVLILRGPGRPLGLAAFDSEPVARAIATASLPVFTGIGDASHRTVADAVAAQAHPTAPDAVQALLTRLTRARGQLDTAVTAVAQGASDARRRASQDLVAARSQVQEAAARARLRAAEAQRRRRLWIRIGAGVLVALLVAAAAFTRSPLWVIPVVLVIIGVIVEPYLDQYRYRQRGESLVPDVTFAEVLDRLGRIRADLEATSSPEEVQRLEQEAEALAARGRQVLERRPGPKVSHRPDHPEVADDWPPAEEEGVKLLSSAEAAALVGDTPPVPAEATAAVATGVAASQPDAAAPVAPTKVMDDSSAEESDGTETQVVFPAPDRHRRLTKVLTMPEEDQVPVAETITLPDAEATKALPDTDQTTKLPDTDQTTKLSEATGGENSETRETTVLGRD